MPDAARAQQDGVEHVAVGVVAVSEALARVEEEGNGYAFLGALLPELVGRIRGWLASFSFRHRRTRGNARMRRWGQGIGPGWWAKVGGPESRAASRTRGRLLDPEGDTLHGIQQVAQNQRTASTRRTFRPPRATLTLDPCLTRLCLAASQNKQSPSHPKGLGTGIVMLNRHSFPGKGECSTGRKEGSEIDERKQEEEGGGKRREGRAGNRGCAVKRGGGEGK